MFRSSGKSGAGRKFRVKKDDEDNDQVIGEVQIKSEELSSSNGTLSAGNSSALEPEAKDNSIQSVKAEGEESESLTSKEEDLTPSSGRIQFKKREKKGFGGFSTTKNSELTSGNGTSIKKETGAGTKASTLLSFEEETEESINTTTKKSSSGKKSKRKLRRDMNVSNFDDEPAPSAPPSSSSSFGTSYTPEMLEQLKKTSLLYPPKSTTTTDRSNGNGKESKHGEDLSDRKEEEGDLEDFNRNVVSVSGDQLESMEEREEEEDDDYKRWEIEQIKKGGAGSKAGTIAAQEQKKKQSASPLHQLLTSKPSAILSVHEIQKKLQSSLAQMEDHHERHSKQLDKIQHDLENSVNGLTNMDRDYKKASEEYVFYQELKEYVADLTDCLGEKAPVIEECEEDLGKLEISQSEIYFKDRRHQWEEESPDFSRDPSYVHSRDEILSKANSVFSDTGEEFSTILGIKGKLESWKYEHGNSYRDAFVSMSVPELFSPYVRLEMLIWDPSSNSTPFEKTNWFRELSTYGMKKSDSNDEDANLIPKLIAKVVIPKVLRYFTHRWNPRSTEQSMNGHRLVNRLLDYLEPTSEPIRQVFAAVVVNITGVLEMMSTSLRDEEVEPAIKLVKNILLWKSCLPSEKIHRLVLEGLVNGRIMYYINSVKTKSMDRAVDVLEKIVSVLPSDWFEERDRHLVMSLLLNLVSVTKRTLENQNRRDLIGRIEGLSNLKR
eukprot:TRINITY_DN4815_c0_g2_i1.p1 TRINITY_DN4815_c0_g2~~TRINITY_DN4815_c0_g2_i1.p1  ORF type:complete len:718 (+),score=211.05 TRINITY_DN4815_c0_g2_i1:81-2234(+)